MAYDVKVPAVGESVQEGEIYKWHKKSGDYINRDEVLLELETDKATVEIVAETSGVVEILKPQGTTVKVGEVVARIDTAATAPTVAAPAVAAAKPSIPPPVPTAPVPTAPAPNVVASGKDPSPAAQRLLKEERVDATKLAGSGRGGQIIKEDVLAHLSQAPTPAIAKSETRGGERRVKLSRMRATIAERLVHAQHTAAMLSTFNEIDMSAVMTLRKRYKDPFQEVHGVGLGFMSFFVKAVVTALKKYPELNGWIEGGDIVYHDYYHVGVAVSTEKGLVVPVIRDADQLSFAGVESAILGYSKKARDNKISLDDLSGGTFTVSNGGTFGSLLSTPILNPPQSGILGMHKIEERAVVIDGQIVARPMMYVALSYDHRIVDGRGAVGFLVTVKQMLEDPARLLLGV